MSLRAEAARGPEVSDEVTDEVSLEDWLSTPSSGESDGLFRMRLPATSANVGPGFDALGLAFSLMLTVEARRAASLTIQATGRDAGITGAGEGNLMLSTYEEVLRENQRAMVPLGIHVANEIPLGMGCGSSAAAICAGLLLANHFGGLGWGLEAVLDEAARREGHPDNVAACLLGGLTASKTILDESGGRRTAVVTLGADLPWRLLLALPQTGLATSMARKLLPESYARAVAISNVQSTALLMGAFALNRPDLLLAATEDAMHQPFRMEVCPLLGALLPLAGKKGVYSVTLSGAGPAVLLIVSGGCSLEMVEAAGGSLLTEVLELSIVLGARVRTSGNGQKLP